MPRRALGDVVFAQVEQDWKSYCLPVRPLNLPNKHGAGNFAIDGIDDVHEYVMSKVAAVPVEDVEVAGKNGGGSFVDSDVSA